ncbi:MAG: beta-glucoside-specific PTS transporter subunit IIABC [Streptococcaceae bacterium]|nr:beta-glucoside-specific PTS transporter subunit IIABC [Streptococcaceae bacterium]
MGKYHDLAKNIVKEIGGKGNINGLTHCITRLRFKLKDESIANTEVLKNMDGVVTVMQAGGQYQVVIGNHVPFVFQEVLDYTGIDPTKSVDMGKQKPFDVVLDVISGCFQPFLAILASAGMIRGLTALLVFLGAFERGSGTFIMLDNIGDSAFMFMPVIIGLTAARKFKVNDFVGLLLGAALMNPNLSLNALSANDATPIMTLFSGTIFENDVYQTFFGIPWMARNYASSVIPIIFIVLLASQIQKVAKKIVPEMLANFFVPFLTVLFTLPLGFLVVGPVFSFATDGLMAVFQSLIGFSPVLFGAVLGFSWQILVMFGLHWAVVPLALVQFMNNGFGNILTNIACVSFGQTAALVAIYLKLKDKKLKTLAIPAIVSGIVGITEPAIYGFTLPRKKVFIFTCIGGMIGGAYAGLMNLTVWNQGGLGVFAFPNYIRPDGDLTDFITLLISIAISVTISFTLTMLFHKEPEVLVSVEPTKIAKLSKEEIISPIEGSVLPLNEASDAAFAQGILGKGSLVIPTKGEVISPFDGTIMTLFPTKHAIGLISDKGVELLIHVGIDTVQLEGRHFEAFVEQGAKVKKGDKLVGFDIEAIEAEGYNTQVPIIVTNTNDYKDVIATDRKEVKTDDVLITAVVG